MAGADNEIKGRLALVTGASGGIGGACARDLFLNGASLALTYSRNKDAIDRLVSELKQLPQWSATTKVTTHQADMASADDIARLFAEIQAQHGQPGPDVLVSNAGYGKRIPSILDIPLDEFDYTLTVNLRASFLLCKHAIPHMQARRWGRIVLIGSVAAYGGGINGCHYAASKAGLQGMMRNLARKHAGQGITVNDVAPAMIGETGLIPDEKTVAGTAGDVSNIPVGRLGVPQEVANLVTMCVKTGYLTGQTGSFLNLEGVHHNSLRPGGWVEYLDRALEITAAEPEPEEKRDTSKPRKYKQWMLGLGFVDVEERPLSVPVNGWLTDSEDARAGRFLRMDMEKTVNGMVKMLLAARVPQDKILAFVESVK